MSGNILFLGNKIFEIPPFFQTRPGDLGKKVHACSIRFSTLKVQSTVPLEPRELACSLTRILLATLLERGPDRNIQSLDLPMNNRSMIDLALNICTLQKVPSRESPSFHSKMKQKMALIPLLRFPRSDFSLSHSFPSRP